jgi:hypothetical protein
MMIEQSHETKSRALAMQMVHLLATDPSFKQKLQQNPGAALDAAGFTAQLQALRAAPQGDSSPNKCKRLTLCEDTCYITCLRTVSFVA